MMQSRPVGSIVRPLRDLRDLTSKEAGGKAQRLGEMLRAGWPVPDGFCITIEAFRGFMEQVRSAEGARRVDAGLSCQQLETAPEAAASMRHALESTPMPDAVEAIPGVVRPLAWSIMDDLVRGFLHPLLEKLGVNLTPHPLMRRIAGRAYLNVGVVLQLVDRLSISVVTDFTGAFGGHTEALREAVASGKVQPQPASLVRRLLRALRLFLRVLPYVPRGSHHLEEWRACVNTPATLADPTTLSDEQLAEYAPSLMRAACQGRGQATWASAVWMGVSAMAGSTCVFNCGRKWLGDTDGSLAHRLLTGAVSMHSAENGWALYELAHWVRSQPDLKQALEAPGTFTDLESCLSSTEGGSDFLERWRQFMDEHGHQARGGMDVSIPRWSEMPDYVLDTLRSYVEMDDDSRPDRRQEELRRERQAALNVCAQRLRNPLKRAVYGVALRAAQRGLVQRENVKNEGVRAVARIRRAMQEAARRLTSRGVLLHEEDIFFLHVDEVAPLLRGEASGNVRERIRTRREEYDLNTRLNPPAVVVGDYDPAVDQEKPAPENTGGLRGLGASPGVVTGLARVILHADAHEPIRPGEILVAPWTDPGWSPYFLAAAAVVVDVGGLLSHGSVVAREYGLPAVVNVGSGTTRIQTGDKIRVDGNRGTVTILG